MLQQATATTVRTASGPVGMSTPIRALQSNPAKRSLRRMSSNWRWRSSYVRGTNLLEMIAGRCGDWRAVRAMTWPSVKWASSPAPFRMEEVSAVQITKADFSLAAIGSQ